MKSSKNLFACITATMNLVKNSNKTFSALHFKICGPGFRFLGVNYLNQHKRSENYCLMFLNTIFPKTLFNLSPLKKMNFDVK